MNMVVQCSPHAVTGFIGLALLTIQTVLPTLFKVKISVMQDLDHLLMILFYIVLGSRKWLLLCAGEA